jgi:hypothetical protein
MERRSHSWEPDLTVSRRDPPPTHTHLVSKPRLKNKQTQKEKGYDFDLIVRDTEGKENEKERKCRRVESERVADRARRL